MEASIITKSRYRYARDVKIGAPEAIDVHHIFIARSGADYLALCSYALCFVASCSLIFLLLQKKISAYDLLMLDKLEPAAIVLWSFVMAGFLMRQLLRKQVEKLLGFSSRQFTKVTCHWSLSLILPGEDKLLLVFKGLYPPFTMLIPTWKALCAAIDDKELTDMPLDCDA